MEKIIFTAGILLLPAVCTTVGAAGAFLFRRAQEPRTQRMTSGMAAGIMLAASVWSLLLPAIERAERGLLWGPWGCCGWKRWPGAGLRPDRGTAGTWCWLSPCTTCRRGW